MYVGRPMCPAGWAGLRLELHGATSGLNANAKDSMPVNLQPVRVTGSLKLCQLGPACRDSELEGVHLSDVASKSRK